MLHALQAPCHGAASSSPGAELCRNCERPSYPDAEHYVKVLVRRTWDSGEMSPQWTCQNYISKGVDIDAIHHRFGADRVAAEA
jgi:hypothetical protein